jgi:hypothetical protein
MRSQAWLRFREVSRFRFQPLGCRDKVADAAEVGDDASRSHHDDAMRHHDGVVA